MGFCTCKGCSLQAVVSACYCWQTFSLKELPCAVGDSVPFTCLCRQCFCLCVDEVPVIERLLVLFTCFVLCVNPAPASTHHQVMVSFRPSLRLLVMCFFLFALTLLFFHLFSVIIFSLVSFSLCHNIYFSLSAFLSPKFSHFLSQLCWDAVCPSFSGSSMSFQLVTLDERGTVHIWVSYGKQLSTLYHRLRLDQSERSIKYNYAWVGC